MMQLQGVEPGSRVAVTGASGLLGSRTIEELARHHDVVGLDLQDGTSGGRPVRAVDLADYASVRAALDGVDAVVHLAIASQRALGHLDEHAYAAAEVSANVLGTRNVLEAAADAGVRRVVCFSSLTIHLGPPERPRIGPDAPMRPRNHYAVTKLYGEQLAWLYANERRVSTVCWRLGQPYPVDFFGPDDLADADGRAIAVTSADAARGILAGLAADLSVFEEPAAEAGEGEASPCGSRLGFTPGFAVANLVSASDAGPEHGYDLLVARRLGYEPGDRFTAGGPVPVEPAAGDAPAPENR